MKKTELMLALLALGSVACGDEPGTNLSAQQLRDGPLPSGAGPLDRRGAERRALELLGGTVLAAERSEERGLPVFEVDVRRASGALVEIDLAVADGSVVEIECDHPADDDLEVEPGFLSLAEARRIALDLRPGRVTRWELELDDGFRWVWEFEIESRSGEHEVEVDARTGEAEVDDDDFERDEWDRRRPRSEQERVGRVLETIDAAVQTVLRGAVIVELEMEDGEVEVEVETRRGARVELEFTWLGRLVEAEHEEGPMGDDLTPPGLLSLSDALAAAGRTFDDLEDWEFERDDGALVYELDFRYGEDVKVNAIDGRVEYDD